MSRPDADASCAIHAGTPASGSCDLCSKPLCKDCFVEEVGGDERGFLLNGLPGCLFQGWR